MRRFIETLLLLLLCLIPLGSLRQVADTIPVILPALSLAWLILYSPIRWSEYFLAALYLGLWVLHPAAALVGPLPTYGLFQKNRWMSLIPLVLMVTSAQPYTLLVTALALWLAWHEQTRRQQEAAYLRMRDDFIQNERLQHRVRQEEALNHEKNLEIAILQERNRISREIHDSVGHTISAALLQIEALKLSAQGPSRDRLEKLSSALASGMEEVRRSLHDLHSGSISLKTEIGRLTEDMTPRYTIETHISLDEETPLAVKRAALTLVREALTNVTRHSDATAIQILLRELPLHYTVTVKDNGSKKPIKVGIGLSSMEEMTRSMGGVFSHGWSKGFFVHMTLPRPAPAEPEALSTAKGGND